MYPQPGQTGQWNPNPPPPSSSAQPQQGQQQWAPPPPMQQPPHQQQQQHPQQPQPQQQPNGQYAPQRPQNQIPPITQGNPPQGPTMTTLQPQHPDQYRSLPAPHQMYGPPQYHQQPPMPYPPQPAPRQRTAIACRYCRRRKIRCSGFDQSEDGRCTNCQRFSQECVFTPVSAQTQAFVPAHTVWRNQGAVPQQLYGAYGQPLPQGQIVREYASPQQPYNPPPNGQYQQQPQYGGPQGGPPQQGMAPPPTQQSPGPQHSQTAGQKRATEEPHTPTLPPPNPAINSQLPQQRGASGEHHPQQYAYPDPTNLTPAAPSPASSATSFQSAQPAQPYYATQQAPRRGSPQQGGYSYDQQRNTISPQTNHATGTYPQPGTTNASDPALRPPEGPDGRNSPANGSRQGVKINELVGPSGGQAGGQQQAQQQGQPPYAEPSRSGADTNMLSQLNGHPK